MLLLRSMYLYIPVSYTHLNSYEMISGHRRMHTAIKAGLETIPAIVRDMDDDDAVVVMVDANIQREELLPSEKAFAYKMKMDAMKRQAGRPSKNKMCIRDRYGASLSGWTDHLDS